MILKRIRLELARDKEFPDGSSKHGYEFAAPLTDEGHLDAVGWKKARERCRVKRFWEGEPNEVGLIVHKPGGTWAFDYNKKTDADDEPGFKFDKHVFKPGEYVSVREHDGKMRTFRVTSVTDLDG